LRQSAEVTKNSKSQISNNKWFDKPFDRLTVLSKVEGLTTLSQVEGQITMTEIVRALLGLPTLRVGSQFRIPKSAIDVGVQCEV
jgi:hypothetical protein